MKQTLCLTLLLFTLGGLNLFAEVDLDAYQKGWVKDRIIQGYTLYTRDEKNSDIVGIRIEGVLKAEIASILANLRQVEGSEDWTPALLKKKTIKNISDLEAVTYSLNHMPWPLWNRELILHNQLHLDRERKLLYVISKSVHDDFPHYPRKKETVMADLRYSNVGFRPVGADKTFVQLTAFVDPKGGIPSWMINFYQKKWPIKYLKKIERRASRTKPKLLKGIRELLDELLTLINKE